MDADEFDEFYRATAARVVRFAYAMCGDRATAQDLAQEAYMRGWQQWQRLRAYDNAEAWIRVVVTRLHTDRWRRIGAQKRAMAALRPPDHVPAPSEETALLIAALRQLPADQRRVLVLHYLLDLSVTDIAQETASAVGTVKSRLSRGRVRLAAALGLDPAQQSEGEEHRHVR